MRSSPEELQKLREARRGRIKRSEWRQIYWPMIGAFAVIVGLALVLFVMPGRAGDALVVFLMLLCPTAVILYAVYVGLVMMIWGLSKGNSGSYRGLEKLNDLGEQARAITGQVARRANEQSIRFNAAFAPASRAMQAVVDPERRDAAKTKTDETHDSNPAQ